MAVPPTLVAATSILTSTGVFTDTQTITICGKVYTSDAALVNTDGHFLIGANQTASHLNLLSAINGVADGVTTAAATTIHPLVRATSSDGTHTTIAAKLKGTVGNEFRTAETQTNASWTSTVMAGGTGNFKEALDDIQDFVQLNSEALSLFANCLNLAALD